MGSSLLVDGLNFLPILQWAAADGMQILAADASPLAGVLTKAWLFFQVALGLGFVIFVHELGHFLAAKSFGVRCDKFYVGFDVPISIGPIKFPRTLGKFQWGETEYGIGIIPLGGYVKMLGQDDDPRKSAEENEKIRLANGDDSPDAEPVLDPRSFPAKSVWQRMIIISAGVVMNLVFAVILAAIAYQAGVPYTPTVAGSTYGGSPSWIAGIEPGDQVVAYGSETEESQKVRYNDFAVSVVMRGFEGEKDFPITLVRGEEKLELSVVPTAELSPDRDIYRIGLNPPTMPKLGDRPVSQTSFLSSQNPDLQSGDVIVAVEGERLPVDDQFGVTLGHELTSRLQAKYREPIQVTLERGGKEDGATPEEVQVVLPASPVKTLGLGFKAGPIVAIQSGSKAESSDLRVGDVIVAVNDEEVVNALRLPAMVADLAGQQIRLKVRRGGGNLAGGESAEVAEAEVVELTLEGPEQAYFDPVSEIAGVLTLGGVGAAFEVTSTIASVSGSAAAQGIEPGDELAQVLWVVTDEEREFLGELFTKQAFKAQVIDRKFNVAVLYEFLQQMPAGATLRCFIRSNNKISEHELTVEYADDWYWHQRGIGLSPLLDDYQAEGLGQAFSLGFLETQRRFTDVLDFLRLLVTGRIGGKGVGGPVAIVGAASSEASFGVSRLLLFLTLLSANLAIINFLPIPALDGGHMVFLIAEAIRGKPVSEALQIRLTMAGVLGLLGLMAFVIVNDILRLVG